MQTVAIRYVRPDLVLKQRVDEETGDETYVIKDRVSNRYWLVGPMQFEVARVFAQNGKSHAEMKQEVQDCFEDEVTDEDIQGVYNDFAHLGLLQLTHKDVVAKAIPIGQYRNALKRFGVKRRKASAPMKAYLDKVGKYGANVPELFVQHQALRAHLPNDPLVLRAGEAFFAADAQETKRKQMAGLPPFLRLMRLQKPLVDPNEAFDRWLPRLRFIYSRWFFALTVLISVVGFATYTARLKELTSMMSIVAGNIPLLVVCAMIMIYIHECMHGLTCKYFGGEVRDMGVMLMMMTIPAAYCDVSDAHLFESRKAKAWVTFAGTYSSFVVGAFGAIVWSNTQNDSVLNHAGLMFAMTGFAAVFSNLNPLIPLDGYFLLCDITGVENLRERAMPFARQWFSAVLFKKGSKPEGTLKETRVFVGYYLFATTYQFSYITVMVSMGWLLLVRGGNLATLAVFCVLVYIMYVKPYSQKLKQAARSQPHVVALASSVVVIFLALAAFVPREAKVVIDAKVVPGDHRTVSAPEKARVTKVAARAGEWVKQGALLVELASDELEIEEMRTRAEQMQLRSELENLGKGPEDELVNAYEESARTERLEQMRRVAVRSRIEDDLALGVATAASVDFAMGAAAASAHRVRVQETNVDALFNDPLRDLNFKKARMKMELLKRKLAEIGDRKNALIVRAPVEGWVVYNLEHFTEGTVVESGEPFGVVASSFALSGVLPEAYMDFFEGTPRCEAYINQLAVGVSDLRVSDPTQPEWSSTHHGATAVARLVALQTNDNSRPPLFFGASGRLVMHGQKRTSSLWLWTKLSVTEGILDLWRMI